MHLAHPVHASRVVQDPLRRRRLAGIDVSHDADVPELLERLRLASHTLVPRLSIAGARRGPVFAGCKRRHLRRCLRGPSPIVATEPRRALSVR